VGKREGEGEGSIARERDFAENNNLLLFFPSLSLRLDAAWGAGVSARPRGYMRPSRCRAGPVCCRSHMAVSVG
jgi:hypothetical protein